MNYAIHVALLLAACYLYYQYVLRTETFFRLNRWLLLGGMAGCFLLPLVTVPAGLSIRSAVLAPSPELVAFPVAGSIPGPTVVSRTGNPAQEGYTDVATDASAMEPGEIGSLKGPAPALRRPAEGVAPTASVAWYAGLDWSRTLWWIYLGGVAIFGVQFFLQLFTVLRTIRGAPNYLLDDLRIVEIAGDTAPYSFWDRVFINPHAYDTATRDRILEHERIHVRERHSADLVLAELLIVVQWCNPFAWWYRRAVENNLEYLTDAEVLRRGADPVGYQLSLLQMAVPRHARGLVTNYNQHFLEQRIKMMKTKRSSNRAAWKYLALPALLLFSLSSFNAVAQQARPDTSYHRNGDPAPPPPPVPPAPPALPPAPPAPPAPPSSPPPPPPPPVRMELPKGEIRRGWTAEIDNDRVCFQFIETGGDGNWNSDVDRCFPLAELGELPRNGIGEFKIEREAGTLLLRGLFDGNGGTGSFDFEPSPSFERQLERRGYGSYTHHEGLFFFFADFTGEYLDYVERANFNPDHDNLLLLAVFGLDEQTITGVLADLETAGYERPDLETLLQLRIFDIDAGFVAMLSDAGYGDLSLHDVVQAKIHGLTPMFLGEMAKLGLSDVTFEQALQLAIHNVTPGYVADLAEAGYDNLNSEEIVSAKIHNVQPEYVRALQRAGISELSLEEARNASIHGVTPDYLTELSELGFENLTIEEVIGAKIHGVSAPRAKEMTDLGLRINDLEQLMSYSIHGVTPELVRGLRDLGYTQLDGDDFVAARIHGVTPDFVASYSDLGYDKIDFETLVSLRIHGVTPEFIEKNRREGDTLEDMISYAIVRSARK